MAHNTNEIKPVTRTYYYTPYGGDIYGSNIITISSNGIINTGKQNIYTPNSNLNIQNVLLRLNLSNNSPLGVTIGLYNYNKRDDQLLYDFTPYFKADTNVNANISGLLPTSLGGSMFGSGSLFNGPIAPQSGGGCNVM